MASTQGERSATAGLDRLVRDRSAALLRTAYLLTGDRGLAEDLLQTALTATYLRWGRLRDEQAAEAYVRKVMATTYTAWWRRKWNGESPSDITPDVQGADSTVVADDRDELRRALSVLTRRQRAAVVLRFYLDLSEAETATALEISVGTVKSTVSRALALLRTELDAPSSDPTEVTGPAQPAGLDLTSDLVSRSA